MRNDDMLAERHSPVNANYSHMLLALTLVAVTIGVYVRLKGIGKWPLAVDEYFIAQSVKNILNSGLPKFQRGGYYVRGLLYQYIAAPFLLFGTDDEFYLRIIPTVLNVLAILPIFCLARKFMGRTAAYIPVILYSFSLWEIEFSRFARMYSPFQAIFMWYLLFLYQVVIEKDSKSEKWIHLLSLVALFTYEGAIFLILLNFLPLFVKRKSLSKKSIAIKLTLLILAYLYLTTDFRHLNITPEQPAYNVTQSQIEKRLNIPQIYQTTLLTSVPIFIICSVLLLKALKKRKIILTLTEKTIVEKLTIMAIIVLPLMNMLLLSMCIFIIALLLGYLNLKNDKRTICMLIVCMFLNTIIFIICTKVFPGSDKLITQAKTPSLKNFLVLLFQYPDIYKKIVKEWFENLPITSLYISVFCIFNVLFLVTNSQRKYDSQRFLFSVTMILVVMIGMIATPFNSTRYTFFLYPLIIILFVDSMIRIVFLFLAGSARQKACISFLLVCFLISSEDFSVKHMMNIDSKEINFRMNFEKAQAEHFYIRMDFRSSALTVNEHISKKDIVITSLRPTAYYLKQVDYIYDDDAPGIFASDENFNGSKAKRDLWTNARVVANLDIVLDLIRNHCGRVWILASSQKAHSRPDSEFAEKIFKQFGNFLCEISIDGCICLYKIEKQCC